MDVLLDEEEEMIAESARGYLEANCPASLVRRIEADPLGYSPDLWRGAAELGWAGMCLPEAYGGGEMPLVYLGLVMREIGRTVAPLPLLPSVVASMTLARHGSAALKERHLPKIASGESIMTWAFFETDARLRPETVRMTAREDGDGFVLNGRKLFVDNHAAADFCLVVARTGAGLSMLVVNTDAPGISTRELVTLAKDRQSEVTFENVRVPREALVGPAGAAWPQVEEMLDLATVLLCAQMVGATRKDIEMAFDYAKVRNAFGQPIGAFQSVQHMCADMQIWADAAEMLTFEALWRLDQGLPAAMEVSQAKSFCNDRLEAAVRNSQIIHGGIGFMMEFDLHLWFRRVSAWSMRMGTSLEHRARIAALLLDTPGIVRLGRSASPETGVAATQEMAEI